MVGIDITSVSPRGSQAGVNVTVTGTSFGVSTGTITFDPLAEDSGPYVAAIVSWSDTSIVFTVPAALTTTALTGRFHDVLLKQAGGLDSKLFKFWVPSVDESATSGSIYGMDYQYPGAESDSANESVDDPDVIQASNINRLMDKIVGVATGYGAVPDPDGVIDGYVLTNTPAGTLSWQAPSSGTPRVGELTAEAVDGTDVTLADTLPFEPSEPSELILLHSGVEQQYGDGKDFTIINGNQVRLLGASGTFPKLKATDTLTYRYRGSVA